MFNPTISMFSAIIYTMTLTRRTARLLWVCFLFHATAMLAQAPEPLAHLDSLLHLYEDSKGNAQIEAGRQVLAYCNTQHVFFNETPQVDSKQPARLRDLSVWFAAERYLTTNSYYKEALDYIDKALGSLPAGATGSSSESDIHETLLCDRAYCLYKTSDYTAAVDAGREAMRLCQQSGNTLQLSRAYLYLSLVNHALRKHDEATILVVKAIETNEQSGDHVQLHNALGIACEIFCSAKEVDRAIEYGKRAVEEARKLDYLPGVANHLTQLSYAYDRKGDYALGLQVADEAIAIVQAQEPLDRNQLALTLEYKSWNLIDIGRHAEAVEALHQAIRLEEEVGNTHAAWNNLRTLAEAMTPIDPKGAVDVLNRYVRMSDSIHSEQMKELMSQADAEFHNSELQEANAASKRMNRIILWSALVVVLLLAAAIASLLFAFRQKQRSAELLHRLVAARESFFTHVTHEFRTPLTVILGIGKELKDHALQNDGEMNLQEVGETIERQGSQLLMLVNQLLDISKVKSAIGTPKQIQGDVAAYVSMVVETQREVARQKHITVDYATDPDGIETVFAPDYVEKVAGNLLANAIKFTSEGGHVDIALHVRNTLLELKVTDTGQGIAADDLPHIFEPFYQAGEASGQGSGVGLALVHQIVDALKGKIAVQSEVGKGTAFTVTLPYIKAHRSPAPSDTSLDDEVSDVSSSQARDGKKATSTNPMSPLSNGGGAALQTILIVEDNADVAQFISRQLEGRYTIHFAADGEQGIEQAQQLLPDLVITDVMMPHTDGYELCRTLRGNPLTSRIPIIIITAKTGEEDRIQGLQAGADAFLLKPFNAEELNVSIEKLLPPATLNVQSDKFAERVQEVILRLMPQGSLDVDSIAAELCLSPSQLRRKMNAATGMSPKKFIMKVRMDAAREMMSQHPDMKLSNIADKCGFYDLSHFIRLYKETYGITPSADHRTP